MRGPPTQEERDELMKKSKITRYDVRKGIKPFPTYEFRKGTKYTSLLEAILFFEVVFLIGLLLWKVIL